ncbi:DUF1127 domain-containing protein [Azospirillum soli]|uniref:DUF1127 domain-containing protein n=1 Tax=Azospirillum soli TaxID=1304799 RepID=UPI001AE9570A|nr:DUF1127 domain-containing protein [Azospirillum soli]MBP2316799.1 uncharacterized protein YjiS (DUF1127 family) [Azospirillum soli]
MAYTTLPLNPTVTTVIATAWRAIVTRLPRRRTITEPHHLDERLLRDIGLTRADLMSPPHFRENSPK